MNANPAAPSHDELAAVLHTFALSLLRGRRNRTLSRTATGVLSILERLGDHRITDLASLEVITQPAMTGLVQRLEAAGLVHRTEDPDDARASLIAITATGSQLLAERRRADETAIADAIAHLPDDQRALLAAAGPAIETLTENYAPAA